MVTTATTPIKTEEKTALILGFKIRSLALKTYLGVGLIIKWNLEFPCVTVPCGYETAARRQSSGQAGFRPSNTPGT